MIKKVMNIMVYLENIRKENDLIYCDYYREVDYINKSNVTPFKLIYNYVTKKIVSTSEEYVSGYAYHASKKLLNLSKMDVIPSTAKEMWY